MGGAWYVETGSSETQKKSSEDSSKGVATSVPAQGSFAIERQSGPVWCIVSRVAEKAPPPKTTAPQYPQLADATDAGASSSSMRTRTSSEGARGRSIAGTTRPT